MTSVAPSGGPLSGGTSITITGTGFISGATVKIGTNPATGVNVTNSTTITAATPAGTGTQSVVVTNPDTQSSNTNITFTYAAAPTVTAITPSSGLNSGSLNITNLEGTGFLTGATVQLQKSGQTSISGSSVSVVSPTQITCTFNLSGAGTGTWNVVVTNTDTQFGTLTNGFTVTNPAPTVTSVAPSGGPLSGGTSITITGTGFISGATVKIGTNPATGVNVTNSTTITAATPAGTGMQSVVVTNPDTQSSNTNITFTYAAAPIVTAITPSSGLNSGSLNITNLEGTGFLTGATVQLQKSGQTSISGSSVSVVSPTQITCTFNLSGAGTGTWNVVVTNTDTQFGTLTNGFTVTNPVPTVTSVAPSGGPLSGGTSITITGTGFISGATVKIGTNPATGVNVTNSTTITAATPAGTGTQSVVVTNPDTQSSNTNITFTYAAASKLAFTGQPNTTTAGANISPAITVTVEDANGNVVTTDNTTQITLAITSGTGTTGAVLSGTKTVTVAAGVATFSTININLVGTGYTLTATSSPAYATPTSSSFNITEVNGGGSGGGGGGTSTTTSGVTNVSTYVNAQGVFNQMISIWSDDYEGVVTIPSSTTGLTAGGAPLTQISFIHVTTPPAFQTGAGMIGLAYDITPNGITFNPAVSLQITYNPASIASGVNPSSLQIAYYDTTQNAWVTIPSTVNTTRNYILAQISHFTIYAVTYGIQPVSAAPTTTTTTTTMTTPPVVTTTPFTTTTTTTTTPIVTTTTQIQTTTTTMPPVTTTTPITTSLPATFEASALSINPSTVKPNENVTVNLKLTNTSNVSGSDTITLQINNTNVGSQIINLDGGTSTVVTFTTSGTTSGKYIVQVAGLNGNFVVSKNISPTLFWISAIDAFLLGIILTMVFVILQKRKT